MARPERPPCPACGRKPPYDPNARMTRAGARERVRKCRCGYIRVETVVTSVTEYFPEQPPPGAAGAGAGPSAVA